MKKYLHYAWVICFGCAFICALTSPIINATATQYLISVTEEFGVSRSAFTLSSTIVALVGMVISPLWGKIYSDRKRMRGVLTITTLGFGLAYMSYSLAQNIGQFYISAVILGFFWAGACFMPVSMMITAWFNKMRGLAMSITLAGIWRISPRPHNKQLHNKLRLEDSLPLRWYNNHSHCLPGSIFPSPGYS